MNNSDAKVKCAQLNSTLPSIHSLEENQFVWNLSKETLLSGEYVRNISWVWLDGSAWDYSYWAAGEPGEGGCLAMTQRGSWCSQHCSKKVKEIVCKLRRGRLGLNRLPIL